jgi:hypothetical protein
MRPWSVANNSQMTARVRGNNPGAGSLQSIIFKNSLDGAPIKEVKFKIDGQRFILSMEFSDERLFQDLSTNENILLSDFDGLEHTFSFRFDNLDINNFLSQFCQIDSNFHFVQNEIMKSVRHAGEVSTNQAPSIVYLNLFKIIFSLYQFSLRYSIEDNQRSLVPYNENTSLIPYEEMGLEGLLRILDDLIFQISLELLTQNSSLNFGFNSNSFEDNRIDRLVDVKGRINVSVRQTTHQPS